MIEAADSANEQSCHIALADQLSLFALAFASLGALLLVIGWVGGDSKLNSLGCIFWVAAFLVKHAEASRLRRALK